VIHVEGSFHLEGFSLKGPLRTREADKSILVVVTADCGPTELVYRGQVPTAAIVVVARFGAERVHLLVHEAVEIVGPFSFIQSVVVLVANARVRIIDIANDNLPGCIHRFGDQALGGGMVG